MNDITLLFKLTAEISAITVSSISALLVFLNSGERAKTAQKLLLKQIAILAILAILSSTAYMVFS